MFYKPKAIELTPQMDAEGLAYFKKSLENCNCYLEYGAGGSTAYACNVAKIKTVISVESDKKWADTVQASLVNSDSNLLLKHCDIGKVGKWGAPKNKNAVNTFWKYMVAPWLIAKKYNETPSVILIDGRFRIASFLYSLLAAKDGTVILFDDYLDRPKYNVVEEFAKLEETQGRMGIFHVQHNYDTLDIVARIAQHSIRWD